jgi:hypothetical protein
MEHIMSQADTRITTSRRNLLLVAVPAGLAAASAGSAATSVALCTLPGAESVPADPIHAALARCARAEAICDQEAAGQTSPDDDLDASASEMLAARMDLATTVPTTWAGLAALIAFVAERSTWYDSFYFEHDEAVPYAVTLGKAIAQLQPGGP